MTVDERLQWSIDMQQLHALDIYREHWTVTDITEVDAKGEGGNRDMQLMDYSGIDKILYTEEEGPIQIAQRFRQPFHHDEHGWTDPDFSLRVETYSGGDTEYDKLERNYCGHGTVPAVYGFGRTPYGRQVAKAEGFNEFYLIDCQAFLRQHFDDDLEIKHRAPNKDGSAGAYFDLDELRRCGCIIRHFTFSDQQPQPDNPADITEWGDLDA